MLCDETAEPWRIAPYPDDDAGDQRLFDDIEDIAVGHRLLDLPAGDGPNALGDVVTIDFGTVAAGDDHARTPLPVRGQRLDVGTKVFLTLTNTSAEPLFVWVFDVGVSGRSALLTNAAPSGTMLGPSGAEDDTTDLWGPEGEPLSWPADVPKSAGMAALPGRWERFVVLVADQRADLSSLSSHATGTRGTPSSALQALVTRREPDDAKSRRRSPTRRHCDTGSTRSSSCSIPSDGAPPQAAVARSRRCAVPQSPKNTAPSPVRSAWLAYRAKASSRATCTARPTLRSRSIVV